MDIQVNVVIVSHNSENVLERCLDSLRQQSFQPGKILVVDSGSDDRNYLDRYRDMENITVIEEDNIGFARANNRGFAQRANGTDFVLFLNPDAFLTHRFIELAVAFMVENSGVGVVGGKTLWFDIKHETPTRILDSTGIFRKWYGRWYDRGQGQDDQGQFDRPEEVPALCGAVMFCRCSALTEGDPVNAFDPDFFLYKEDIELSLRLRKEGWSLRYLPDLIAYHGRGWARERKSISLVMRRTAAESELLLYKKHPSPYMLWAILKYLVVRIMRV
jgi:GT2 family glycosyltransferase